MKKSIAEQLKPYNLREGIKAAKIIGFDSEDPRGLVLEDVDEFFIADEKFFENLLEYPVVENGYVVVDNTGKAHYVPELVFEAMFIPPVEERTSPRTSTKYVSKTTGETFDSFRLTSENRYSVNSWPGWAVKALYRKREANNSLSSINGSKELILRNEYGSSLKVELGNYLLYNHTTGSIFVRDKVTLEQLYIPKQ